MTDEMKQKFGKRLAELATELSELAELWAEDKGLEYCSVAVKGQFNRDFYLKCGGIDLHEDVGDEELRRMVFMSSLDEDLTQIFMTDRNDIVKKGEEADG